jgi:hypothetical protein
VTNPEFQVGDVVRLKEDYLYDEEDIDRMYRLVIVGELHSTGTIDTVVLVQGAGEDEFEEVGTHKIIDIEMYEIDPKYERRVK